MTTAAFLVPAVLVGIGVVASAAFAAPLCPVADMPTISHGTGSFGRAVRVNLNRPRYPRALCNDGSPGAYFMVPGIGSAAHRWVILLQGGGACTGLRNDGTASYDACADRRDLVDVRSLARNFQTGILADVQADNRDFFDATKIVIGYCSSDYWTGSNVVPPKPSGFNLHDYRTWRFAGHEILDAALTEMLARSTPDTRPTEVLYTGTSAGGLGVIETVSEVAARFAALPNPPRFVAAADAGYGIRVPGYDPTSTTPPYQSHAYPLDAALASGADLWGGHGDRHCVDASDRSPSALLDCRKPEFILSHGYIRVPMLIEQSRMDTAQLRNNGIRFAWSGTGQCEAPRAFAGDTAKSAAYARCFAYQMQASLESKAMRPNAPLISVYAPDEATHVESTCSPLFRLPRPVSGLVRPLSDQDAIGGFYRYPCISADWEEKPLGSPADCGQAR